MPFQDIGNALGAFLACAEIVRSDEHYALGIRRIGIEADDRNAAGNGRGNGRLKHFGIRNRDENSRGVRRDRLLEGVYFLFRVVARWSIHVSFDAQPHFLGDVAQARVCFLPIRQINVCGDQDVMLFFLVVGLLAAHENQAEQGQRRHRVRGTEFHGEASFTHLRPAEG